MCVQGERRCQTLDRSRYPHGYHRLRGRGQRPSHYLPPTSPPNRSHRGWNMCVFQATNMSTLFGLRETTSIFSNAFSKRPYSAGFVGCPLIATHSAANSSRWPREVIVCVLERILLACDFSRLNEANVWGVQGVDGIMRPCWRVGVCTSPSLGLRFLAGSGVRWCEPEPRFSAFPTGLSVANSGGDDIFSEGHQRDFGGGRSPSLCWPKNKRVGNGGRWWIQMQKADAMPGR